jgi:hypothetical protein
MLRVTAAFMDWPELAFRVSAVIVRVEEMRTIWPLTGADGMVMAPEEQHPDAGVRMSEITGCRLYLIGEAKAPLRGCRVRESVLPAACIDMPFAQA